LARAFILEFGTISLYELPRVLMMLLIVKTSSWCLRPCQHDNDYMDGRSQNKVHTDERTQVHSTQSSLAVTHQSTNRARRYLSSVTDVTEQALVATADPQKSRNAW